MSFQKIQEPSKEIPILEKKDVIVVGGGTAGVAAAIAAAREGANVVIIERTFVLGGMMTSGLVTKLAMPSINRGLARDIFHQLEIQGEAFTTEETEIPYNSEALVYLLDQLMEKYRIKVLLGTIITDVIMEKNKFKGIIIENKSGAQFIPARVLIDATGDGDAAIKAGADFKMGREEDNLTSAPSLVFKMHNVNFDRIIEYLKEDDFQSDTVYWKYTAKEIEERHFDSPRKFVAVGQWNDLIAKALADNPDDDFMEKTLTVRNGVHFYNLPNDGEVMINSNKILDCDGTNGQDVSDGMIEGRKQAKVIAEFMQKYVPGFEEAVFEKTAEILGVRESRRIVGDYILNAKDILGGTKFSDSVCRHNGGFEVHDPTFKGVKVQRLEDQMFYDIPYRSLIAKDIDGILLAGRCYSADHHALSAARCISLCMSMGEAAGTAAALASKKVLSPRELDIEELQNTLLKYGADIGSAGLKS